MTITTIRLLFDFGLLVLIWMVQLMIYPSFQYHTKTTLLAWHKKYMLRISLLVIPLMFGQLATSLVLFWQQINFHSVVSLILITMVWLYTFIVFVPLHRNIENGNTDRGILDRLVQQNWRRTCLWTLICISSLFHWFSA